MGLFIFIYIYIEFNHRWFWWNYPLKAMEIPKCTLVQSGLQQKIPQLNGGDYIYIYTMHAKQVALAHHLFRHIPNKFHFVDHCEAYLSISSKSARPHEWTIAFVGFYIGSHSVKFKSYRHIYHIWTNNSIYIYIDVCVFYLYTYI